VSSCEAGSRTIIAVLIYQAFCACIAAVAIYRLEWVRNASASSVRPRPEEANWTHFMLVVTGYGPPMACARIRSSPLEVSVKANVFVCPSGAVTRLSARVVALSMREGSCEEKEGDGVPYCCDGRHCFFRCWRICRGTARCNKPVCTLQRQYVHSRVDGRQQAPSHSKSSRVEIQ
jgi:hypothetical protein